MVITESIKGRGEELAIKDKPPFSSKEVLISVRIAGMDELVAQAASRKLDKPSTLPVECLPQYNFLFQDSRFSPTAT